MKCLDEKWNWPLFSENTWGRNMVPWSVRQLPSIQDLSEGNKIHIWTYICSFPNRVFILSRMRRPVEQGHSHSRICGETHSWIVLFFPTTIERTLFLLLEVKNLLLLIFFIQKTSAASFGCHLGSLDSFQRRTKWQVWGTKYQPVHL